MFKIVAVLALIIGVLSVLQVYSPECWVKQMPNSIEYTLSNFGEIPYGQTIIGKIYLPTDPLLCNTTQETSLQPGKSNSRNIMLVKRGKCKFTQKVINAQNLGADLIIIYDDLDSLSPRVIMKNDGHGHLAEIPSLFISHSDGNALQNTSSCNSLPVVKILFEIDQRQKSDVTLWLDASNRETYVLARDFYKNKYFESIKDKINLNIRFRVESRCEDWICSSDDCVGTLLEKYCRNVVKSQNVPFTKGVDLIKQQLREYFLWEELKNIDSTLWWRYMTKFDHNICLEEKDVEECSYAAMKEIGVSDSVVEQVKKGITSTLEEVSERKPSILRTSQYESSQMGVFFYPEATINDRNFYGLFKAPEVFEAICNSLIDPPYECIQFINSNHTTEEESEGVAGKILLVLGLMTLGFIVALWVYTKVIKKEVNQQLSVEVNRMVEKYVNIATKKGDTSGSSYNKFDQ